MKIGICCYPSYGGSGVVATELGKHLARRGHDVHFISYDKPFRLDDYQENVHFHGVDTANYPVFKHPPYIMALANKMAEVAERENLEIIHAHYAVPHATAVMLANQMVGGRLKTVTTLHGTDVTIMSEEDSLKQVMAYSVNQSDVITAVSNDLARTAEETLSPAKAIQTIHNFINIEEYNRNDHESIRGCLHIEPEEKVIVHTSNFRAVKRIEDVIRIFDGIQKVIPAKLLLVGDGPDHNKAYELVDKLGLSERVEFLGKQSRVVKILSASDLFLLPSEKESFGLAALEAMACEVPVVASRTGGLPEVIDHGKTGWLAQVGDVEEMVRGALHILGDEKRHKAYGKSARQRAAEYFNADRLVKTYEKMYESLLQAECGVEE